MMKRPGKIAGFTLLELVISMAILAVIVLGLQQSLGTALSSYSSITEKQDLIVEARLAMERLVMFAQETDKVLSPVGSNEEVLKVSERVLDTYTNTTHVYTVGGDGRPDADNNADGLVNTGADDLPDYITFDLDKTDSTNWKLMEQMPDYSTAPSDLLQRKVICEHVTEFRCSRLSAGLVEIRLSLSDGKASVSLRTRALARLIG
jgi:prepilin-type N-terminal cleavage/methylation domain-containing protein